MMYVVLAIIPGLILISWIYTRDKLHPEPKRAVFRLFLLGACIVLPAGILERVMLDSNHIVQTGIQGTFITAFFVAGMVEEFLKAAIVERGALQKQLIHTPIDGIVYAAATALGFATVENILYVTSSGFSTALLRSVTAVPAHFMFGIIMGYQFSKCIWRTSSRVLAYILPALAHGLYDTFALSNNWFTDILLIVYLLVLVEICLRIIDKAKKLDVDDLGVMKSL